MLRATSPHAKPKPQGRVKFPGIGRSAERLGVSRVHLYLVLSGRRPSRRLLARYNQLKGQP